MKRIKINVTKTDIKKGQRCAAGCCPIALAVLRKFKGYAVSVSPYSVGVGHYNALERWKDYALPRAATEFIFRFDAKQEVEPFSFTIRATA